MQEKSNNRSGTIISGKIPKYLLAAGLVVSGGGFASASTSAENPNAQFDFVQKAAEQGYTAEEKDLRTFIQDKAEAEGKTYDEVANDIFVKTQAIHAKYYDEPLYNDLTSEGNTFARAMGTQNAVPLSSVTNAYVMAESNLLLTNTETVVSGDLNIEYGVDSVVYSSGSFRNFVSINASSAFVLPSGTGTHNWSPAYETATLEDSQTVNFRAYGNLESKVDQSVSAGFELAGFSVSSSVGTTVTLRKSHQIDHNFTLY